MISKLQRGLIILHSVLFILLMWILAHNNRLILEEYEQYGLTQSKGIVQTAVIYYNGWGGHFFPSLLSYSAFYLVQHGMPLWIYSFSIIILLILSITFLMQVFLNRMGESISFSDKIYTGTFISSLIYYLTIHSGESWFWVIASSSYLFGMICFLAGLGMLLLNRAWSICMALLMFFYTGAASEPFAFMCVLFFGCMLTFRLILNRNWKKYFFSFIFTLAGIASVWFSEGRKNRMELMPEFDPLLSLWRDIAGVVKFYTWLPELILPLIITFMFGAIVLSRYNLKFEVPGNYKIVNLLLFIGFNLLLFLSFLPSCILMHEPGPERSWHHLSLYLFAFAFIAGGYTGIVFKSSAYSRIFSILLIAGILFEAGYIYSQYRITGIYAKAYDQRMEYIYKHREDSLIKVPPLPPSGALYSQEFSENPNHFRNMSVKKGLFLKGEIILTTR